MTVLHGIPDGELAGRRERLSEQVRQDGSSGYVLFDDKYIQYFTGFGFLSTERPVVFAQSAGGDMVVFVPEFEVARVRAETAFERVESYPEYPGIEHPMLILARVLGDLGIQGAISADQDGYPGILGYQGPALSAATAATVAPLAVAIEEMMVRKSASEIALIRESARWCEHAHRLLQEYTRPGVDGGRGEPQGGPRGDARDAGGARRSFRRPAGLGRRRIRRLPRPDRAAQLVGARRGPQHRVPAGRRARHRDEPRRSGAITPSSSAP